MSFVSLMPPNATALELAIDETIAKEFHFPIIIDTLLSPEKCPVEILPFLAWAMSVDDWSDDWPESTKRKVIAAAIFIHRYKGTRAAVVAALEALNLGVQYSEWYEYEGTRHRFRVDVPLNNRGLTELEMNTIFRAIENSKNARSVLERLKIYMTAAATVYMGVHTSQAQIITCNARRA